MIRLAILMILRFAVSLRYRITITGLPDVQSIQQPVLLLPNHPGLVDPIIIITQFYLPFRPRVVLYEGNFTGLIRTIMVWLMRAVSIPDLRRPSHAAQQRTEQAVTEIIAGLRRGENFVMWPSGHAQRDGLERLGAARALSDILQAVPECVPIRIRTRGVWGSMFSVAHTGQMPSLWNVLLKGALLLLSNLLFLTPKRNVQITVERLDPDSLPSRDRDVVNRSFEQWYNLDGPEQPTFVPYHFLFGPRTYQFPPRRRLIDDGIAASEIKPETRRAIAEILADQTQRLLSDEEMQPEHRLEDLGLDSLQRMDVALAVERRFGCSVDSAPETVGQLIALAQGVAGREPPKPAPEWFLPPHNLTPLKILGETIPESFVARALSTPHDIAAADDLTGALSYERLLTAALLMAERFARLPGKNIGLVLPASVASDMMLMGLYLADKLPILLNWTTGPGNLRHAVELTELTHVISSRQLRDRLNITIEGVNFVDVEDLRQQIGWIDRIRMLLTVRYLPNSVRSKVPQLKPDDNAVVLFTSGSEKAPKAVPLSHQNVISNLRIIPAILDLTNHDALLGFLPMFHSFGFTMTGLFPLLGGIRVVHHPDPTDVAGLCRKISAYKPTVFVAMPSLVSHLLQRAQPQELESLRYLVVGAEKCPQELFAAAKRITPQAMVLEGYGVTECSPAVAANRPGAIRPGTIGQALPGVEVCVVDLETNHVLPTGKTGMLLVHGPGVFAGYLGSEKPPFTNLDGKRWYVTGDLVVIDSDGYIHFSGRLKRFIKAGGEMISLPALEEPFTQRYPPDDDGPRVAVEGIETEQGRTIVLFSKVPIELKTANAILTETGFTGVMRLDAVRQVDQIPVLGTGKVDYKQLRTMIKNGFAKSA